MAERIQIRPVSLQVGDTVTRKEAAFPGAQYGHAHPVVTEKRLRVLQVLGVTTTKDGKMVLKWISDAGPQASFVSELLTVLR
jgi:hypothetical protein